jgi:hypothetical protein
MKATRRTKNYCPKAGQHEPLVAPDGKNIWQPFSEVALNVHVKICLCKHCGLFYGITDAIQDNDVQERPDEITLWGEGPTQVSLPKTPPQPIMRLHKKPSRRKRASARRKERANGRKARQH